MIRYRHLTLVGTKFRSRNWRNDDGTWPWTELQERWQSEPRIYIHHRPNLMTALSGHCKTCNRPLGEINAL